MISKLLTHLKASGIMVIFFGIVVLPFFFTNIMFVCFYQMGVFGLLFITVIYYLCYKSFDKENN